MNPFSEFADLAIVLALVCVPLAVGAVFIPLGRALADRLQNTRMPRDNLNCVIDALHALEDRVQQVEQRVAKPHEHVAVNDPRPLPPTLQLKETPVPFARSITPD
ncbi:MAG: hypothetical protein HEQ38_02260 [Gemmatimonas sp.]|jgi:hypothetical protein|nr:hypothetical protein [Gemmatimonas sp.]